MSILKLLMPWLCGLSGVSGYCSPWACLSTRANSAGCNVCASNHHWVPSGNLECTYSFKERCLVAGDSGECLECEKGYVPVGSAPDDFKKFLENDLKTLAVLFKLANIKAE